MPIVELRKNVWSRKKSRTEILNFRSVFDWKSLTGNPTNFRSGRPTGDLNQQLFKSDSTAYIHTHTALKGTHSRSLISSLTLLLSWFATIDWRTIPYNTTLIRLMHAKIGWMTKYAAVVWSFMKHNLMCDSYKAIVCSILVQPTTGIPSQIGSFLVMTPLAPMVRVRFNGQKTWYVWKNTNNLKLKGLDIISPRFACDKKRIGHHKEQVHSRLGRYRLLVYIMWMLLDSTACVSVQFVPAHQIFRLGLVALSFTGQELA